MRKTKKPKLAWIYSRPKEPIEGDLVLETDLLALEQEFLVEANNTVDVIYMLPNGLAANFERHAVSQWKKFYKTIIQLKQQHPTRISLVSYEDIVAGGHTDRQAQFLGSAFSLKLMDPDLFDLWCSLEAKAQLGNRPPVNTKLLIDLMSPNLSVELLNAQIESERSRAELLKLQSQLKHALIHLHALQAKYEALESKPPEVNQVVAQDDKATAVLIERLHRLQSEHEKLLEQYSAKKNTASDKPQPQAKPQAEPEANPIELQRLQEKLIFTQGELARQHALCHVYKTELIAVQAVLGKTRDFLINAN